jgi:hypothetical protein
MIRAILVSALLLLPIVGCGGGAVPTEQMASAKAAVRASHELGAATVPDARLHQQLAEEQIARARKLMEDGENDRAALVLERAQADAELSVALARQHVVRNNGQMGGALGGAR